MSKMTAKQIDKWLQQLPQQDAIFARDDWTGQQHTAVFAAVAADRAAYVDLFQALDAADRSLAGIAQDCANENIDPSWNEHQFGYWREMFRQLANAAALIWENENRSVNAETGRTLY